jgi:hypothetical protein
MGFYAIPKKEKRSKSQFVARSISERFERRDIETQNAILHN